MRHQLTHAERKRGGRTVSHRAEPRTCPHCGRQCNGHASYAGHLGLHAYARRFTNGDLAAAAHSLHLVGRAYQNLPGGQPELEQAEAQRVRT